MHPRAADMTFRANWQLPQGVERATWEYVETPRIAEQYDDFFALNRLFQFDEEVVSRYAQPGKTLVDLGSGTGRALIPQVRRGLHGVAVDLSQSMLEIARDKAQAEHLEIKYVRANLVELDCIASDCFDLAVCLFSTLGMIKGHENRQRMLRHSRRILKHDGVFILHVHNFWFNLVDPLGLRWLLHNLHRSAIDPQVELGDKYFLYRGITNMFLHVFTRGEITRELRRAGFRLHEVIPLATSRQRQLRWPWLLGRLRANGWILVCRCR